MDAKRPKRELFSQNGTASASQAGMCRLCLSEKYFIMFKPEKAPISTTGTVEVLGYIFICMQQTS